MESKIKICIICEKKNTNYKCPQCKINYCSVPCFKIHKESCKPKQIEPEVVNTEEINNKPLFLDEYNDIILDSNKLGRLKENKSIMTKLKNKRLVKIIKEIDSTKYKKKMLEKMLDDKDFKEFVDEILLTLGYLKENIFTY